MHASVTLLFTKKTDFEGQSVIKASSYLLPFVLEANRESLPRSCESSARRLSAESAEVYSTADLPASAAHIPFSATARHVFASANNANSPSHIGCSIDIGNGIDASTHHASQCEPSTRVKTNTICHQFQTTVIMLSTGIVIRCSFLNTFVFSRYGQLHQLPLEPFLQSIL